jgi:hypothetical protein
MTEIRKVPAGDGAEWLLGGFALLRTAPLALGLLGLIWGALSAAASMSGNIAASLVMWLLGPILFAGVIHAAREVDSGRQALPAHLLHGMREGRTLALLALLLPQIAALVLLALLLVAMLGGEQLQQVAQVMEQMQTSADPELARSLPTGTLLGWLLMALVVGVVAGFFTFVAVPEILYRSRGAFSAMGLSFRACVRNLGALLVMVVLLFIAFFALSLAISLLTALLGWAIGARPAQFIGQLLMFAIVLPVTGGMVYHAWRRMLGDTPLPPPVPGAVEA